MRNGGGRREPSSKSGWWIFLPLLVFLIYLLAPTLNIAIDNVRLVEVFDSDEASHLAALLGAFHNGHYRVEWYSYGQLYFNLCLIVLNFLHRWIEIGEREAMLVMRWIACLGAVGVVGMTVSMARTWCGWLASLLSGLSLVLSPIFISRAHSALPDSLMMFLMLISVWGCLRFFEERTTVWLVLSSVFAGLAFSTRLGGIFLLPALFFVVWRDYRDRSTHGFIPMMKKPNIVIGYTAGLLLLLVVVSIGFKKFLLFYPIETSDFYIDPTAKSLRNFQIVGAIMAALCFGFTYGWRRQPDKIYFLNRMVLVVMAFVGSFAFTSPYAFFSLRFIRSVQFDPMMLKATQGMIKVEPVWKYLYQNLGLLIFILLSLSSLLLWFGARRKNDRGSPIWLLWIPSGFFFLYFALSVQWQAPKYILYVLPFLLILAMWPIQVAEGWIKRNQFLHTTFMFAVWILFSITLRSQFSEIAKYRDQVLGRESSERVEVGKWLESHYSPKTRILFDEFSYIPPIFEEVNRTLQGTMELLADFNPDLVVVSTARSKSYQDARSTESWYTPDEFQETTQYYSSLQDGSAGYRLKKEFGQVNVYERNVH